MLNNSLTLSLALLASPFICFGQDGALDPTFGTAGLVSTDFGGGTFDEAKAVTTQPDGMILVAGTSGWDGNQDIAVARYWIDGSLDDTFGTGGKATAAVSPGNDIGTSIALQADGKIIVGGYTYVPEISFALVRFLADGTLDASFGTNGMVNTVLNSNTGIATGVAVQPDGKILLCGGGAGGFSLVRYDTDGAIDATFGTDGLVLFPGGSQANAIGFQSDGKIILTGYGGGGDDGASIVVARFDADGTLDATFGTGGSATAAWNGDTYGNAMAIGNDDLITVVGTAFNKPVIARFLEDGAKDLSIFGTGIRPIELTDVTMSTGLAVALQPDGKPVLAGYLGQTSAQNDFLVVRALESGVPDLAFGTDGAVTTDFDGTMDRAQGIAVLSNGSIVVVGSTFSNIWDRNFALARYTVDFTTGVENAASTSDAVRVFPNPASTVLHISTPDGSPVNARLYDMVGHLVMEQGLVSSLDIAGLAPGSYTMVTTNGNGGAQVRTRFVKQ